MKPRYNKPNLRRKLKCVSSKARRLMKAYSSYIYKIKKMSLAVTDTVVVPGCERAALCTRIGTEAARLAKLNQRGTITQREVCSAVRALRKVPRRP